MKTFPLVCLFALILLSMFCNDAKAFEVSRTDSGRVIKWSVPQESYHINGSGGPSGCIHAIRRAAATWTNVTGSPFVFSYAGTTVNSAHGSDDGVNLVNFGKLQLGTLAENAYWYNPTTGRMLDSDLMFNTRYRWATTVAAGYYDVQNIATHELGHSLSLEDLYGPNDTAKTMYGWAASGETKKRTLTADDINGITYLYHY